MKETEVWIHNWLVNNLEVRGDDLCNWKPPAIADSLKTTDNTVHQKAYQQHQQSVNTYFVLYVFYTASYNKVS